MLRILRALLVTFLVLAVLAGGALYGARVWLEGYLTKPGPLAVDTTVYLPAGSGLAAIAGRLADAGAIGDETTFRLVTQLIGRDRRLKAGEYAVPAGISPQALLDLLESGETITYKLTVPEGLTVPMVWRLVEADPVLTGDMPATRPPEGTLLPETYIFERGSTRTEMIERMAADLRKAVDAAWAARAPDLPLKTPEEALVLASIIEKETSIAAEYPIVAGVFVNRLRKGMPLQTDPSVIYAITKGEQDLDRPLTRKDLQIDDPYNTYKNQGLPPGPIANPGIAAIKAALAPADTEFLYFVADGTGGHAFAKTLDEHNRNVAKWRRIQAGDQPADG